MVLLLNLPPCIEFSHSQVSAEPEEKNFVQKIIKYKQVDM